jgi:hypothetical protein
MAPLHLSRKFRFHDFFFQIDASSVTSSCNQPPNPIPFDPTPLFNANMWIFVEEIKRKRKDYRTK